MKKLRKQAYTNRSLLILLCDNVGIESTVFEVVDDWVLVDAGVNVSVVIFL